jgi:hypothetical protein
MAMVTAQTPSGKIALRKIAFGFVCMFYKTRRTYIVLS